MNSHEALKEQKNSQAITITVVHEDSGREVEVKAGPGTPVRTIIERAYAELGIERNPADRLRVETSGTNVFEHLSQHLGDFLQLIGAGTVWLLAGPTGGA
ncbi:hypothetical protein J2790_000108 [Paenarthrobacter nicotinovorans]|uniref:hypothetical protein n=1 Tax=Micrococcaceae TaxID=1268 RepID=UPI000876388F|nr:MULTISPECIES: hypothetical protein [Micrococcaceae]MDR6434987.1 hypothetical protein [Paenarthrobacter nicotinovorans]SCZ59162.1 hypothetical protein SAMN02799638_02664 [Arthrobacter sp. UNCCL28]